MRHARSDNITFGSSASLAFLAGVLSTAAAWCAIDYRRRRRRRRRDEQSYYEDYEDEDVDASFLRWVRTNVVDDIKTRIGELPSVHRVRRTHWPWDREKKNRSPRRSVSPETERHPPSQEVNEKSDFCIGSIFGLDVGGTLAKLVYFEQKAEQSSATSEFHPLRERMYQRNASAQAVLLARRGVTVRFPETGGDGTRDTPNNESDDDDDDIYDYYGESTIRRATLTGTLRPRSQNLSSSSSSATRCQTHPRRRSIPSLPDRHKKTLSKLQRHSADSNDDLETLYKLRQESVPDDLHAYARSVHLQDQKFHTTESMDVMLKEQADREKHSSIQNDAPTMKRSGSTNNIRKSRSMFDFSKGRNEALDRFYTFARRLDSYREGVKDHKLSFYSRELGGEFHFIRFETRRMRNAMDLIRANNLHLNIREMGATGGGAHKFASQWEEELGITMQKQEELDSLVAGMQFVLSTVVGECYTFRPRRDAGSGQGSTHSASSENTGVSSPANSIPDIPPTESDDYFFMDHDDTPPDKGKGDEWWWSRKVQRDAISFSSTYPYMLVTIGTGVSVLRVDGPQQHERVSGSTIGGGTYWGLIRLLTDCEDFEDVMRLVERGDPSKVDMMVGDIYGANTDALEKIGLPSNLVASSFGKLVAKEDPAQDLKQEDLARALLLMITNNIGQVAYLNAKLYNTQRIYFVGNFLRENKISQKRLSYAIDYWSKGEMEALFLEHEGYFGALGAFLLSQNASTLHSDRLHTQQSMPPSTSASSNMRAPPRRSVTIGSIDTCSSD